MLPDLPALKEQLQDFFNTYIQTRVDARVGNVTSQRYLAHEGDRSRLRRADGSIDDIVTDSATASTTIATEDIPTLTLDERFRRLNEMADSMAEQMTGGLLKSLMATLEQAGQKLDATGRPFDANTVLDAFEKMEMDFDTPDGEPDLAIFMSPSMAEKMKAAIEQSEEDPAIKARHKAVMARKRAEWRDREAARKLVG